MQYEVDVRRLISETVTITTPIDQVDIDDKFPDIGIDSLTFVNIIIRIEDEFDISFPDDELDIHDSGTIKNLCSIITRSL